MINGIIVTTFSAIREEAEMKIEDKNNKCYICSIPKVEFEKRKIIFNDHIDNEHNIKDYINYILNLKFKKNKDLDKDEIHIKNAVMERNIYLFPIYRSKSLGGGIMKSSNSEELD